MISIEQLGVEFGGFRLFDDISFLINPKDKISLVGKNGAGKTTLLNLLSGKAKPSKGNIIIPSDLRIGYLPQHMIHINNTNVIEEAGKAFEDIIKIEDKVELYTNLLSYRTDYESTEYLEIIEKHNHYSELLQMFNPGNTQADIEKTLIGLGFAREDFERPCSEFSGGWRMRIELAKILLQKPDLMLLDEPTNHLDLESIQWLENFLINSSGAVILVSHDKAFIDNVTNRTIEISLGRIYDYNVNYSKYLQLRKERREQQIRAFENQQKMIKETEEFIDRFRYKATKANQVQSRVKQLDKLERIEVDLEDTARLNLRFPPSPRSGSYPVKIENLSKSYDQHLVLDKIDLTINRGEKVAFVGKNGEGKTTLIKCIMNEIAYQGEMTLGHNVKIGYFAQNQASLLDNDLTVFDTIDHVAVGDIRTRIRDILGAFMFGGEESDKMVKVLSGGERSRLAMIKLLLEPVNLLILDEPTNHLDIQSKQVLKEAILAFDGTAIIVSHDREFLDGLVTKTYEFKDKKVREYIGGIYEFLQKKNIDNLKEIELSSSPTLSTKGNEKIVSENKLSFEARKKLNRKIRKLESDIANSEDKIDNLETLIENMHQELQNPEKASDLEFLNKLREVEVSLENEMTNWAKLNENLEKLSQNNLSN